MKKIGYILLFVLMIALCACAPNNERLDLEIVTESIEKSQSIEDMTEEQFEEFGTYSVEILNSLNEFGTDMAAFYEENKGIITSIIENGIENKKTISFAIIKGFKDLKSKIITLRKEVEDHDLPNYPTEIKEFFNKVYEVIDILIDYMEKQSDGLAVTEINEITEQIAFDLSIAFEDITIAHAEVCIAYMETHDGDSESITEMKKNVETLKDEQWKKLLQNIGVQNSKQYSNSKCAHSGCTKNIELSGDTIYCKDHSNKCLYCGKYIDEDASICMTCIESALGNRKK